MSDLEMNDDASSNNSPEASGADDLTSALGGGALYFNHVRQGPASAGAAPVMSTADAKKRISQFLDNGKGNVKVMEQMLHNTEKVVQQFQNYPSVTQVPLGELKTNPFRQTSAVAKDEANDPDLKKKLEAQRQAALKNVQNLQLQSVMKGEQRSTCMINNTLYREGQTVDEFFIEKINPNSVVVR